MKLSLSLDQQLDCNKICKHIQKNLFDKCMREKIPIEGRILYLEIKETSATIEPEKLKITES